MQLPSWQEPVAQLSLALGKSQVVPHAAQFASVLSGVSQPSVFGLLLQSPNPELHWMLQLPALHEGVPLLVLQGCPQPPQCCGLDCVLTSQPLLALPSQFA